MPFRRFFPLILGLFGHFTSFLPLCVAIGHITTATSCQNADLYIYIYIYVYVNIYMIHIYISYKKVNRAAVLTDKVIFEPVSSFQLFVHIPFSLPTTFIHSLGSLYMEHGPQFVTRLICENC